MGRRLRIVGVGLAALVLGACGVFATGSPSSSPVVSGVQTDALQRGLAAHTAGRIDDAIRLYHEALVQDPGNEFAFFNLGEIEQTRKDLVAAEAWYRLALQNDAKMPQALYNLGIVRYLRGDYREAADLQRALIQQQPNNGAAHYNLALALRALGQTAEASSEFATAQRLDARLVPPTGSVVPQPSPTR